MYVRLGMVRSRNGRSRYCPFQELSVLGTVALGIVASRNGRVRNCHVRNCRVQEWSCQELSRLGMVVLRIVASRNGCVRNCRIQEWSFQEWSHQEWSFQDWSFQDWYKYLQNLSYSSNFLRLLFPLPLSNAVVGNYDIVTVEILNTQQKAMLSQTLKIIRQLTWFHF